MKTKLMIMAGGLVLAACSATVTPDKYTVNAVGIPESLEGKTAFLVNYDTGDKIDSVTVVNKQVVFDGTVESPLLARLIIDGNRMGNLILEKGDIRIENGVASGSELNDLSASIGKRTEEYGARFDAAPRDSTGEAVRVQVMAEYENFVDSVFQANAGNPIGYVFFLDKAYGMSLEEIEKAVADNPSLKGYTRVNKLVEAAKKKQATGPGNKFADFTVTNGEQTQKLSDYVGKGKPVLVDFWASWCGPCIRETKVIKELLEEFGPQGLEVLGVAVWDEPENTRAAIEQHELPWPQIINAQTIPTDLYGISGIPCILLIAPDGTILSREKMGDELRADVKAMMDGTLSPETFKAK